MALIASPLPAAETGGCPHAAIREDISGNVVKLEELTEKFHPGECQHLFFYVAPRHICERSLCGHNLKPKLGPEGGHVSTRNRVELLSHFFLAVADFMFIESGGDNLAANFSRELSDFTIYVVDVAGGTCMEHTVTNMCLCSNMDMRSQHSSTQLHC